MKKLFIKYSKHINDCGSTEIQIIYISLKIKNLLNHIKFNRKDKKSKLQIKKLILKRLKLLNYLENKNKNNYFSLLFDLKLVDVVK